jgi:hypothetical protein
VIQVRPGYDAGWTYFFTGWFLITKTLECIKDVVQPYQDPCREQSPESLVQSGPDIDHQAYGSVEDYSQNDSRQYSSQVDLSGTDNESRE